MESVITDFNGKMRGVGDEIPFTTETVIHVSSRWSSMAKRPGPGSSHFRAEKSPCRGHPIQNFQRIFMLMATLCFASSGNTLWIGLVMIL